jgi:hypothetical protein
MDMIKLGGVMDDLARQRRRLLRMESAIDQTASWLRDLDHKLEIGDISGTTFRKYHEALISEQADRGACHEDVAAKLDEGARLLAELDRDYPATGTDEGTTDIWA